MRSIEAIQGQNRDLAARQLGPRLFNELVALVGKVKAAGWDAIHTDQAEALIASIEKSATGTAPNPSK